MESDIKKKRFVDGQFECLRSKRKIRYVNLNGDKMKVTEVEYQYGVYNYICLLGDSKKIVIMYCDSRDWKSVCIYNKKGSQWDVLDNFHANKYGINWNIDKKILCINTHKKNLK